MPRKTIDLDDQIEYLSILDKDGQLDENLDPTLDDDLLRMMHDSMLLTRRFDEQMMNMQRQGRIGTFAPVKGQEAVQVGSCAPLTQDDWVIPSFREAAAFLWRGQDAVVETMRDLLLFSAGFYQGSASAHRLNMLPVSIPVSSQIPHAAGIAYAMKYRGSDTLSMVYFGDGATSEGDFHEGLNFAAVFAVPCIFICQNNHWAISIPRKHQTRSVTLAQKALAYGMPGIQVDGNDVLAVYVATREAAARARNGGGPTLIECVTYRISVHTTADDPTRYRDDREVEDWKKRDPIRRFQKYLAHKGLLDEGAIEAQEEAVKNRVDDAVRAFETRAKELAGDAQSMFDHLYAELPPYLAEQRDEFLARGQQDGRTR